NQEVGDKRDTADLDRERGLDGLVSEDRKKAENDAGCRHERGGKIAEAADPVACVDRVGPANGVKPLFDAGVAHDEESESQQSERQWPLAVSSQEEDHAEDRSATSACQAKDEK